MIFFIEIALECFEKQRQNKKLLPLNSIKGYTMLYHETSPPVPKPNLERSPSFARRSISSSPTNQQRQPLSQSQNIQNNKQTAASTETSLAYARSRSEGQNNANPSLVRQTTKSSDFRSKKLTDNQNKGLDRINEETPKREDDSSASSSKYKIRYSSARSRAAQQSTNVVELKPATVEVFFRNSGSKIETNNNIHINNKSADKLERKAIATTVFPPPRIGLKS